MVSSPVSVIVGLGNPGVRYEMTRHNVGFLVLDALQQDASRKWESFGDWDETWVVHGEREIRLVRPQTFMNRSGLAVARIFELQPYRPEEMLVVYDDIDLPWGRLRLRQSGGPGGHRGMESIVEDIGSTSFPRLRIGVGQPNGGQPLEEFVLETLTGETRDEFESIVENAAEAVRLLLKRGVGAAMNEVNPVRETKNEQGRSESSGDGMSPGDESGGGSRHDG